jgi:ABC-2 type transport system ATP-binding protein
LPVDGCGIQVARRKIKAPNRLNYKIDMQNAIEVFSLTKRFSQARNYRALVRFQRREEIIAVDNVNLQIREGELFGLLGPNGAGKTTLVKMLCTLILPTSGRALVSGKDVVADANAVRPLIGLVDTQERSFFWRLTGRQNIEFFAALQGLHGKKARERIAELFDLVGLKEVADRRFLSYSTGMRQKLAIARGLLTMPPVLFMDEPTRSLDPVIARELRRFIRHVLVNQLKRTVVLVTHRLEEAEEICDTVAIMNRGRLIAQGPVSKVKQHINMQQHYLLQVQDVSNAIIDSLRTIPGVVRLTCADNDSGKLDLELFLNDASNTLPLVMRSLVSAGGAIQHCQAIEPSLEEAFVHLIKEDRRDL